MALLPKSPLELGPKVGQLCGCGRQSGGLRRGPLRHSIRSCPLGHGAGVRKLLPGLVQLACSRLPVHLRAKCTEVGDLMRSRHAAAESRIYSLQMLPPHSISTTLRFDILDVDLDGAQLGGKAGMVCGHLTQPECQELLHGSIRPATADP